MIRFCDFYTQTIKFRNCLSFLGTQIPPYLCHSCSSPKHYSHTLCTPSKALITVCCICLSLSLICYTVNSKAGTAYYSPLYPQSQPQRLVLSMVLSLETSVPIFLPNLAGPRAQQIPHKFGKWMTESTKELWTHTKITSIKECGRSEK